MAEVTLVTGAQGFIGMHLCGALAEHGNAVVGIARGTKESRALAGARLIPLDLRNADAIQHLIDELRPAKVFNLAAVGVNAPASVAEYVDVNVRLPVLLYEALPESSLLIQVGSVAQYKAGPLTLSEGADLNSNSLYGWSKNSAELLLEQLERRASTSMRQLVRVRLFGVTGPGESPRRLLPTIVNGVRCKQAIPLSDGHQVRDMLHVDDAVRALIHVANTPALVGRAVNVGRGEGRTVRSVAQRAIEHLGGDSAQLRFGAIARRPDDADVLVADSRILSASGWTPTLSYDETIDIAVSQIAARLESASSPDR